MWEEHLATARQALAHGFTIAPHGAMEGEDEPVDEWNDTCLCQVACRKLDGHDMQWRGMYLYRENICHVLVSTNLV